jgi:hypothetical protein
MDDGRKRTRDDHHRVGHNGTKRRWWKRRFSQQWGVAQWIQLPAKPLQFLEFGNEHNYGNYKPQHHRQSPERRWYHRIRFLVSRR